jgi:small subunit ribosomal protein S24e
MDLKIISNTENKAFGRKEIMFSITQSGSTSKRAEVHAELCKALNLKPESTIIVKIDQSFGSKEISAVAHSYETKELMDRYEPRYLLDRVTGQKRKHASGGGKKSEAPKKEGESK